MCESAGPVAATVIAWLIILLVVYIKALAGGSSTRTERHAVEVYHGNWDASWHTSLQANIMGACGAAFAVTLIGMTLGGIFLAFICT